MGRCVAAAQASAIAAARAEEPAEGVNGCSPCEISRLRKWAFRIFPSRHVDHPRIEGGRDCLTSEVVVHLDWRDVLRLLFSWRCRVVVKTTVPVLVDRCSTSSSFEVLPPRFLDGERGTIEGFRMENMNDPTIKPGPGDAQFYQSSGEAEMEASRKA